MTMDMTSMVVGGVIGVAGGLSKDIIFSWLSIGREKDRPSDTCSEHREKLGRIEERMAAYESELSKGSKKFQLLQETLEKMSHTLAVLLDRSNRHRGGDDNG